MLLEKKYVGVALESNEFKIAEVEATSNGIKLLRLDRHTLVDSNPVKKDAFGEETSSGYDYEDEVSEKEVFGFDEQKSSRQQEKTEIDFSELEAQAEEDDAFEIGAVDEEKKANTNYVLLYNILNKISRKRVDLAINLKAGETIFQVVDDTDYREVKEENIVESIEDKLHAIYGEQKSADYYAYEIREDGSLVIASIEETPQMLEIIDETKEFYRGRLKVKEIYPDEVALVGLFKTHYDPDPSEITALIQFGEKNCRIIFLQGEDIYLINPLVDAGTSKQNFLNILFSKILFQLDSGEVPSINRIVLANNSVGSKAVEFFKENFTAVQVENFQYKESFLDRGKFEVESLRPFTTTIALGTASVQKDDRYPALSMLPEYVQERQQIFKLEWHGILLLVLIFLTFPVANYFYQLNAWDIGNLSDDLQRTNNQIEQVQPIVDQTNEISQNLSLLSIKLSLLDSLSQGSRGWSTRLDLLNEEMSRIPNSWFVSMSKTQDGTFLEGYGLYRNRIPAIVDIFDEATLLNVNTEMTREQEIYKFSIIVQQFSSDTTKYSPEKPARIQQLLSN